MHRLFLACLVLIAVCVPVPVAAFVDRNDVSSAAQFSDYVPASYLEKAGITDSMTVDAALDAYITYALSFSSPTAYAYIAQLSDPAHVKIHAGGSTTSASRGDVVSEGWNIEVGDGVRVAIRYPGGILHTITGPYTYTVPAYGTWGENAVFGLAPVGTNSRAFAPIPDTSGYAVVKQEIACRGGYVLKDVTLGGVTGTVYLVHYSQNPADPDYFSLQIPTGSATHSVSDTATVVVGPGSSALVEHGLDVTRVREKTLYVFEPASTDCIRDTSVSGGVREKTIFDSIFNAVGTFWNSITKTAEDIIKTPTVTAGVRG
ncbi:MAG: hypothetical protein M0R30_11045 [Methanoregula sp.]|jgi:hypothetical protein|uniref:hypothetical protein n=1 Tax=Methanoregula sp. TaxID=2052170 RepID=UPI0025D52D96|nr:hypothetical protein [Methanoregula sp.]MCK9632165.1 hypothetical protein [Methanoregula sp.]